LVLAVEAHRRGADPVSWNVGAPRGQAEVHVRDPLGELHDVGLQCTEVLDVQSACPLDQGPEIRSLFCRHLVQRLDVPSRHQQEPPWQRRTMHHQPPPIGADCALARRSVVDVRLAERTLARHHAPPIAALLSATMAAAASATDIWPYATAVELRPIEALTSSEPCGRTGNGRRGYSCSREICSTKARWPSSSSGRIASRTAADDGAP